MMAVRVCVRARVLVMVICGWGVAFRTSRSKKNHERGSIQRTLFQNSVVPTALPCTIRSLLPWSLMMYGWYAMKTKRLESFEATQSHAQDIQEQQQLESHITSKEKYPQLWHQQQKEKKNKSATSQKRKFIQIDLVGITRFLRRVCVSAFVRCDQTSARQRNDAEKMKKFHDERLGLQCKNRHTTVTK